MMQSPSVFFSPATVLTIAQRARSTPWRLSLPHVREDHLLIWVTRGAATCFAHGKPLQIGAHNALLVPAGSLFSFTYEQTCFGQTVILPPDAPLVLPETPQLLRVREPKAQLELSGFIEAIQSEVEANLPLADAAVTAHAQLMSVWFHRYRALSQSAGNPVKPSAAERLIHGFCDLVVQSPSTPLNGAAMAKFAEQLGVTPTHLARVCKEQCGQTASDLLTRFNLQRALRALSGSKEPAAQIAKRLGFSSPAYFTRFISAHTGKTPSQLRSNS